MANVTMKDVANEAGVSTSTVSHVINNTRFVDEGTRKRVEDAMSKLSYVPNALARSLRRKSTNTIGIVVSDIGNSFFTNLVRACEDEAYKKGYNTILCNSDEDPKKEKMYLNVLQQKQVDGIILSPTGGNKELISIIEKSNIPIVFVDRFIKDMDIDFVGMDNFQAGYKSVQHLHKQGHKKIALMYSFGNISSVTERIDGYKHALKDVGIGIDEDLFMPINEFGKPLVIREKMKNYLEKKPAADCILVLNNYLMIELMRVLRSLNYKCPEDIAIMGFEDFYWASSFEPYLTMVNTPVFDMGHKAVEILVSKIHKKHKKTLRIQFPTEVIIRDSCGSNNGPGRFSENLDK